MMRVQIVHHQNHGVHIRITLLKHLLDETSPIESRAPLRDFDLASSAKRFHLQEYIRHALAHIFVVHQNGMTWRGGYGCMHLTDELHA